MTDKIHFDNLTKINVPFALLDDDTQTRLKAWPYGWECVPLRVGFWVGVSTPAWLAGYTYRAKPDPATQDTYPWDGLPDWVQYAARNEEGDAWGFASEPHIEQDFWDSREYNCARIDLIHKGYHRGTIPWDQSLQKRPELDCLL